MLGGKPATDRIVEAQHLGASDLGEVLRKARLDGGERDGHKFHRAHAKDRDQSTRNKGPHNEGIQPPRRVHLYQTLAITKTNATATPAIITTA